MFPLHYKTVGCFCAVWHVWHVLCQSVLCVVGWSDATVTQFCHTDAPSTGDREKCISKRRGTQKRGTPQERNGRVGTCARTHVAYLGSFIKTHNMCKVHVACVCTSGFRCGASFLCTSTLALLFLCTSGPSTKWQPSSTSPLSVECFLVIVPTNCFTRAVYDRLCVRECLRLSKPGGLDDRAGLQWEESECAFMGGKIGEIRRQVHRAYRRQKSFIT